MSIVTLKVCNSRSPLSTNYRAPSVSGSMPSNQYGAPEQYKVISNDGYGYANNGLDDHDEVSL